MTKLAVREPSTALTPMDMLDRALAQGANVEVMEKLMGLQERWETNNARKAYNDAIAQARAEIPVIFKSNEKTGMGGSYKYEDLGSIARIIDPILSSHGLSYRFKSESNGEVRITCVITHRDGHSEENSLTTKPDTTGSKNAVQALGSAVTYLQRYTLKLALGIATSKDDDGESAGGVMQKSAHAARKDNTWGPLIEEMRSQPNAEALKRWGLLNANRILEYPESWRKQARDEYERLMEGFKPNIKQQLADSIRLTDEEKAELNDDLPDHMKVEQPSPGEAVAVDTTLGDPAKYLDDLDGKMAGAKSNEDLDEIWGDHYAISDQLSEKDQDLAQMLFERHDRRIKATQAVDARLKGKK